MVKSTVFKDTVRGSLYVCEAPKNLPFKSERLFWITDIPDKKVVRAGHAHHKVKEVLFAVKGSFKLSVDDGKNKQEILMGNPRIGVYLGPKVWRAISQFSKDCVTLVIAEKRYDKKDYIADYEKFKKYVKK